VEGDREVVEMSEKADAKRVDESVREQESDVDRHGFCRRWFVSPINGGQRTDQACKTVRN
jgi:hypothetical protein